MIIKRLGVVINLSDKEEKLLCDAHECLTDIIDVMQEEAGGETNSDILYTLSLVEKEANNTLITLGNFLRFMDVDIVE